MDKNDDFNRYDDFRRPDGMHRDFRGMGPYGRPGMFGIPGMYSRWVLGPGRMYKDVDLGNLALGEPHVSFFDTRKIVRESLRKKHPKMSDLKLDVLSFVQALVKHPFRKSIANASYNHENIHSVSKLFKKDY